MRAKKGKLRIRLHSAIALMLLYCENLKAIRYESTSLNRIVADKSRSVIVALESFHQIPGHNQKQYLSGIDSKSGFEVTSDSIYIYRYRHRHKKAI